MSEREVELSDGERDGMILALFEPDHDCVHNMRPLYDATEAIIAARLADAEARAEAATAERDRWKTLAERLRGDGAAIARVEALAAWCEREEAQLVVWYGHQQCVSHNAAKRLREALRGDQ